MERGAVRRGRRALLVPSRRFLGARRRAAGVHPLAHRAPAALLRGRGPTAAAALAPRRAAAAAARAAPPLASPPPPAATAAVAAAAAARAAAVRAAVRKLLGGPLLHRRGLRLLRAPRGAALRPG